MAKGDRIIQIILLLLIATGLGLIGLNLRDSSSGGGPGGPGGPWGRAPSSDESAVAVETALVDRQDVSRFIRVNGDVVSDVSVDIYPDVTGQLKELFIRPGTYVRKGEVIARVDPSSPGEVYTASDVLSTIDGTVTSVYADVGDRVSSGSSVAEVGDLQRLSVITYIPERYINYLKIGLMAEIGLESFPGKSFQARVIQLNPVVDSTSRSLEIKLEILDPDPQIRAGMFAAMKLITQERKNVIALPLTALSTYYDESVVYVLKEQGTVERRTVQTGLASETVIEITDGLDAGEEVVVQGVSNITDGTKVQRVDS